MFSAIRHRNTRGTETATKEIILAAAVEQYGAQALQESPKNKIWEVKMGNIQLMSPPKKVFSKILSSSDKNRAAEQAETLEKYFGKVIDMPILDSNGKEKTVKLKLEDSSFLFNFGSNNMHYMYGGVLVKSSYDQNKKSFEKLFGKEFLKSLEEIFKTDKNFLKKENKDYILNQIFSKKFDKS